MQPFEDRTKNTVVSLSTAACEFDVSGFNSCFILYSQLAKEILFNLT